MKQMLVNGKLLAKGDNTAHCPGRLHAARKLLLLFLCVFLLFSFCGTGSAQTVTIAGRGDWQTVDDAVSGIIAEMNSEGITGNYNKALWLHNWLINNANYDYTYTWYSPEGVLLYGTGVCESYSQAYSLLLDAVGIENMIVTSLEMNHAWNLVKLDGNWCHVDVTWDDPNEGGYEYQYYFGMSDELISRDHVWDRNDYPACTTLSNYYLLKAGYTGVTTPQEMIDALENAAADKQSPILFCYIGKADQEFSLYETFQEWYYSRNWKYGLTGFGVSGNRTIFTLSYGEPWDGPQEVSTPAPDFTLSGPQGESSLSDYAGKGLVLIFGQPSCMTKTCALLENLQTHLNELRANNIETLVVMNDASSESDLAQVMSDYPAYRYAYQNTGLMWNYLRAAGYSSNFVYYPCIFVIDPSGTIIYYSTGHVYNLDVLLGEIYRTSPNAPSSVTITDKDNGTKAIDIGTTGTSGVKLTYKLGAVVKPANADQRVTWKSSNPAAAVVNQNGVVTAKGTGTTEIRAESALVLQKYDTFTITVVSKVQPGSLTISGAKTISVGQSVTLKASFSQQVQPTNKTIAWTSSDASVASVSSSGGVKGLKTGSTVIKACSKENTSVCASQTVKVIPQVTSVKLLDSAGSDVTGKTITIPYADYQLKAVVAPSGALQKVTWKSSDGNTAAADANGKVTFKKSGTVTVTATAADGSKKSASVKLTYNPQKPDLVIKDSNIRGKNREIQVVIPWGEGWSKIECKLYDDETDTLVSPVPAFRERKDSTGKNKVISWVGDPLVNGNVYRIEIRVWNGQWSDTVKKYGMPIPNVYGATVVAGNKTMIINTKHREPCSGTRYMIFDAATEKELAYKAGTRSDTTWTYSELTNGKLYYVVAVPYRDYKGQRLWGPNENKIFFIPMGIPGNGTVKFSGTNAAVSIGKDGSVDGIRVLYRTVGGSLMNGCESAGNSCVIKNLNSGTAYEFYAMKYKTVNGKKHYSMGIVIPYRTSDSGIKRPQSNPVVTMTNSGHTTFTIKKAADAAGISVLYREGEGDFRVACEAAGNSCSTTLDVKANYTFCIMQYKLANGKKVYSSSLIARDFSSGK